jgi:hypothetical protein
MAPISKEPLQPEDPIFSKGLISVFGNGPAPAPSDELEEAPEDRDPEDDDS